MTTQNLYIASGGSSVRESKRGQNTKKGQMVKRKTQVALPTFNSESSADPDWAPCNEFNLQTYQDYKNQMNI